MDKRADLIRRIKDHLAIYAVRVDMDKGEASRAAENFYCDLLNILLGYNLQNMNRVEKNYPAIDLGEVSEARKLGVQVTSTATRQKVQDTLDTFFRHEKEKTYTRLVMLVINKWTESRKKFRMDGTLDFDAYRDIWDTDWLLDRIEEIEDIDHLEQIKAYMERHLDLIQKLPAPLDLPLRTAMDERNFVGRESELDEIAKRFDRNEKIVVLSGLGGMGKTELAVRFAQNYDRGEVYFAGFRRDFFHTVTDEIAQGIEGLTEQKLDEEAKFKAAMAVLRKCGTDDLLILDNADTEEASFEQLKREASVLPMRILITTRCDAVGAIDIDALHREELHRIFCLYADGVSEADMDALIDAVDAHTLTVDLMARSMRPGRRAATPEKLLTALNKRDLTSESFMKVATNYPGGLKQARINEHLKAVFKVAELDEAEQALLCCATLLPNGGMDDELFMVPFAEEMQDVLDALIQKGWLLWKDKLLKIHPVIRIVCREELRPTNFTCESFLYGLCGWYDPKKYDKNIFLQLAELFTTASKNLPFLDAFWAITAGHFWMKLGEAQRALNCGLQAVVKLEECCPDSAGLARAYNNVGSTYADLGEHKKALDYKLKALAIDEKVLPSEHFDLAALYNNVGTTYRDLGEYCKALDYQIKALAIWEKTLSAEHLDLATCYNNVGDTYSSLGDPKQALEYQMKALAIREKVLPPEHPDLATSNNNVGTTYRILGDFESALEYNLKALVIQEKVLPPEHPDLATSYNNVGGTYGDLGNPERALEYQMKALAIREKILLPEHYSLATSYNNVGNTYYILGDYKRGLEYTMRALAIRERMLPPEHPELAQSYSNVGTIYGVLGDHEREMEYLFRAREIQEKVLPQEHPYNAMCCSNISLAYARMENFAKASEYANRALEKAERSMQGHPNLKTFQWAAEKMRQCASLQEQGVPFDNPFK